MLWEYDAFSIFTFLTNHTSKIVKKIGDLRKLILLDNKAADLLEIRMLYLAASSLVCFSLYPMPSSSFNVD